MKKLNFSSLIRIDSKQSSSFLLFCMIVLISSFITNLTSAQNIKVMKQGIGNGTITATVSGAPIPGFSTTYDGTVVIGARVTLTVIPDADSRFMGFVGNFVGSPTAPGVLSFSFDKQAGLTTFRAIFELVPLEQLRDDQISPDGIQDYLNMHTNVNSMQRFISVLPPEYRRNWILMTRSESLQTGTAQFPRILLPSEDAKNVFSIGMVTSPSFPSSHPFAIEYMQWDEMLKTFRFHEIVLSTIGPMNGLSARPGGRVAIDDAKCFKCHSTQNVIDTSRFVGTTGIPVRLRPNEIVKSKAKPNWDNYDSWAGMLPFNRDRIYEGSVEEKAFRAILNLWNWRGTAQNDNIRQVIEQLDLQEALPQDLISRIRDNVTNETHLFIDFANGHIDRADMKSTNHAFGTTDVTTYAITQGGRFVVLKNSRFPGGDEGRGVVLFDLLGGDKERVLGGGKLNQKRVADEIISHKFATGSHPIDIRPIAYAIITGKIRYEVIAGVGRIRYNFSVPAGVSVIDRTPFLNARHASTIEGIYNDTRARSNSLPRRKADLQRSNMDRMFPVTGAIAPRIDPYLSTSDLLINGLYQTYGGVANPTIDQLRAQIFKRSLQSQSGPDYIPASTINGDVYVEREDIGIPPFLFNNTEKIALMRYFLEPLGVSVDMWSMGVRSRAGTYTFADIFKSGYVSTLTSVIGNSLGANYPMGIVPAAGIDPTNDVALINAINTTLGSLPAANETPKFTDVQRIFNKRCIACHGGLNYPPAAGTSGGSLNFSELEDPSTETDPTIPLTLTIPGMMGGVYANTISPRLWQSYYYAQNYSEGNFLYDIVNNRAAGEHYPFRLMPANGPMISDADRETLRRWIQGNPERAFTLGDPHLKTINGVEYDFQAEGEFTLLRGDFFEVQTRQKAVTTNSVMGPNEHTGLATCVSINTAVAIFIAGHRITYQPSIALGKEGRKVNTRMELRIDGKLVSLNELPKAFAPSSRIVKSEGDGGIQIEGVGGNVIVITPWFWTPYNVWGLFVDIRKTQANEGLIGMVQPNNWLPALPSGSLLGARPESLTDRFNTLYNVFGKAWRVTNATSLFDYAPGTSTATFTNLNYPINSTQAICVLPNQPGINQVITRAEAEQLTANITDQARRKLCILDLMATGEKNLLDAYIKSDRINKNRYPNKPILEYPAHMQEITDLAINFNWKKTSDNDGDAVKYRIYIWDAYEFPNDNKAIEVPGTGGFMGQGVWKCQLIILLIALVIIFLLYFLFFKKNRKLFYLLCLLVLALAFLACKYLCKDKSTFITYSVSNLQHGKAYLWKVIAEDGHGGVTSSDINRVIIK